MQLPPSFQANSSSHVCRLLKFLYKQAGTQWYGKLSTALTTQAFHQAASDPSPLSELLALPSLLYLFMLTM